MTLTEKIAYIKGLTEGLKLDDEKSEVKVINAIVDLLDDMATTISNMEDSVEQAVYQVDELDESLSELEDVVYGDDCFDFGHDDDCDCDDCFDFDEDENVFYEVTCPTCGEEINVEEEILLCGETQCPNCGEILEFDFSDLFDEDDECGCGCDDCCNDEDCDCTSDDAE